MSARDSAGSEATTRTGGLAGLPNLASAAAAVALIVVLSIAAQTLIDSGNPRHAAEHLAVAGPLLLLTAVLAWGGPPPEPTRIGRWGRRLLVVGLSMMVAGLVLESIGAFGYDGDESRIDALTKIHNGSWMVAIPGMIAVLIGLALAIASVPQKRH